jgi:hypothetical protein
VLGLHNGLRWVVIAAAIAAFAALLRARSTGTWDGPTGLLVAAYPIAVTVQLVIGAVVWLLVLGSDTNAFRAWIHPLGMVLMVGAVHAGFARARRTEDIRARATTALTFYGASLLGILLLIPRDAWPT